jgi:hypothetical protein
MNKKQKTDSNSIKEEKQTHTYCTAFVFLLLATTTYFIVTKGFDYVKDIIGHPTKELLEAEWISTYGNPELLSKLQKCFKELI